MANGLSDPPFSRTFDQSLVIRPRLPIYDGIFHLGPDTLIASHPPHKHIAEHLHDHLYHMHIRYGFELPAQPLHFIPDSGTALQVAMAIDVSQRVDCNPVFVAKGNNGEGICLKIAGQDVHWVHDDEVAKKATELYQATGRTISPNVRFIGFSTSDLDERRLRKYTADELKAVIGNGLRVDQHFQATWIEPKETPIAPYDVTIFLSDDVSEYYTFFELFPTVKLGLF
ncbi:hypothetical protein DFR50_13246 [Roseiarcus fermentans]|uniref:Uncharacterized protein n=1 Tax=Roseiarcus fermentans TaxID=1473586 RepID=A0A366EV64_9HYPH|nr:hypothetical protein [Roseiarcus fermentans]RBP06268.1 hypothetical protein DFR50_13246 [Roseiarcus fermentans]